MRNTIKFSLLFLSFSLLIACKETEPQVVVPTVTYKGIDPEFERALIDLKIDEDNKINGKITSTYPENIKEIHFLDSDYVINSLKGIEIFINLNKLVINAQYIKEVDLNSNPKLEILSISSQYIDIKTDLKMEKCVFLKTLTIGLNTTLDISPFKFLESITISSSTIPTKIMQLDEMKNLIYVSLNNIELSELSFGENNKLYSLHLSRISDLENLNVSSPNLSLLWIANSPSLKSIDLSYSKKIISCITQNNTKLGVIVLNPEQPIDTVSIYPHSSPATKVWTKDLWTNWKVKN